MGKFNVGDIVKLNYKDSSLNGEEGVITKVDGDVYYVRLKSNEYKEPLCFRQSMLELVEESPVTDIEFEEETYKADTNCKFRIGDLIKSKKKGNVCEVIGVHEDGSFDVEAVDTGATATFYRQDVWELVGSPVKDDAVNHPSHYCKDPSGIECIEITKHRDFCIGNAIKYLWRAGLKQDADKSTKDKQIEDLQKAIWYINAEIDLLNN